MRTRSALPLLCLAVLVLVAAFAAADPPPTATPPPGGAGAGSMEEVNKQLSNPIGSTWSIAFQQSNYRLEVAGHSDQWSSNLNFQPMLPVRLTKDWFLITRPIVTLMNSVPYLEPQDPSQLRRTTTLGDTVLTEMVGPSARLVGNWLLGIGPTFTFPTAASDLTGQGKWQVGPAAVLGYMSQKWIAGVFVQDWASFAGDRERPDTDQMKLQPIMAFFLPNRWTIGYSGTLVANWKADSSEAWTIPVGVSVSKLLMAGRLPVKVGIAAQYMVRHPSSFGQKWNFQISVTPVIPNLVKGILF